MSIKVGMISLGCPKNQIDAEIMLAGLKESGFVLTPHVGGADVVIINTCGFIEDAKKESIENTLETAKLKKEGAIRGIVVSGCLSGRYFKEMRSEFPEVNCILSVGGAGNIEKAVRAAYEGGSYMSEALPEELALEGKRIITTLPFYSYLRIAEGCDNRCSFCVIPDLRGRYRSRRKDAVVEEARSLAARGVKELVVVAQDTSRYGYDIYGRYALPELLRTLCGVDGIEWVRLLYCYPDFMTDDLIGAIASEEKIVKYVDMPIQHVSQRIVKAMNRRSGGRELSSLIAKMRAEISGLVLRTTLMVGFPGETDAEFEELAEFVKKTRFERLGVFCYSREEGTPAAEMPDQVDEEVKSRRKDLIMEEQSVISEEYNRSKLGSSIEVLAEGYDRYAGCCFGRSAADAPDIDGKVFFKSARKITPGSFVNVKVKDVLDYDLLGEAGEGRKDELQ